MNDNDEMEHDVGLDMECAEETDDQHIIHVKREPIDNEKEDSSDEVPLLVDSGCHIKAEPPGDEEEDSDFTVMRYQGCVESGIFGEGGTDMTSVVVKTEPCDQTDPCDDQVKFDSTRLGNMATFQFETFSSNSPDQVIKTGPDCNNIPFEVDQNGQMELHDLESKRVCVKTERCIEGTDNELNSGRSGSTVFSGGPSNVCVFPHADTTRDSTHLEDEWQGLAGLSDTGDEESVGSPCLHPNYSAAPRPGLLPIHVVDPLHGDRMKIEEEEEEPSLSVTGVIPNLHAQHTAIQLGLTSPETEALDLRQAVGQSTGEPFPVNFITSNIQGNECNPGTTTPVAAALPDCVADSLVRLESSNSQCSESTLSLLMAKQGVKCDVCDMTFTSVAALKQHKRIHITGGNLFSCEYCGMIFMRKSRLTQHERTHTGERPFKCTYCEMGFAQKGNLKQHELIHTGVKPFACEHCDMKFTQKSAYSRHERLHTGEKPFSCIVCEMKFAQKGNLKHHEQIHAGGKRFKCEQCGKGFTQKSFLEAHEGVHSGVKPFKCGHCEKTFTSKSNVTQHERLHTGEKLFKCEYCEMRFTRRGILKQHERIHTGEKPFACDHCGMRFPQKSGLNQHELIHTGLKPFQCEYCEMRFSRKEHCIKHERIHTGEKFDCEYCAMRFTQKGNLHQHVLRIHSKEKPFKCMDCQKGFTSQVDLKRHKFVHVYEKPLKLQHF